MTNLGPMLFLSNSFTFGLESNFGWTTPLQRPARRFINPPIYKEPILEVQIPILDASLERALGQLGPRSDALERVAPASDSWKFEKYHVLIKVLIKSQDL